MTDTTSRELIKKLRAEEKDWRESVGDMPIFAHAADALEALLEENERLLALVAESLEVMDSGHYGDPEVPFRMRKFLEEAVQS